MVDLFLLVKNKLNDFEKTLQIHSEKLETLEQKKQKAITNLKDTSQLQQNFDNLLTGWVEELLMKEHTIDKFTQSLKNSNHQMNYLETELDNLDEYYTNELQEFEKLQQSYQMLKNSFDNFESKTKLRSSRSTNNSYQFNKEGLEQVQVQVQEKEKEKKQQESLNQNNNRQTVLRKIQQNQQQFKQLNQDFDLLLTKLTEIVQFSSQSVVKKGDQSWWNSTVEKIEENYQYLLKTEKQIQILHQEFSNENTGFND
ncbi:structural maintenance of chromosomes smc family member [Anaeramoeba flamelloides]|uniref:Structural maintenance of chromosomes smc family member n=1 Tax=Anaeramoeba flamelloides TaxID=1746091 RepID=A0ABQ8ZDK2_9EUKA|nr:structural maintenance of chromosomes smc family member [Anaeramoeba flamelloides]